MGSSTVSLYVQVMGEGVAPLAVFMTCAKQSTQASGGVFQQTLQIPAWPSS